jgi:hypothetical protein
MDIVQSLYKDAVELDNFLMSQNELSLRIAADANLRKSLLLASASYYERQIGELILDYARSCSNDERIVFFIKNKAISRQYHTLFNWDAKNCNSFLALFGEDFKKEFSFKISTNPALEQAIKYFLEIGSERNRMVHQDFGQYSLEKTSKEINEIHENAKLFISELRTSLFAENKA